MNLLQKKLFAALFITTAIAQYSGAENKNTTQPNVIIILADDMGFSDINCYGGEISTPNIDKLAENGIKFSQFYNSARCCPTRASLMTGLHPAETGIGHMTNVPGTDNFKFGAEYPGYQGALNKNCVTIAEALSQNNYATLICGKWHLGMNDTAQWPLQRGFEKFYGSLAGATNFFFPEHPRGITENNTSVVNPKSTTDRPFYTTDAFTDHAIEYIKTESQTKKRPFFLYLAYTSPHWPLQAHNEETNKYLGKYTMGWDELRQQRFNKQVELGLISPSNTLSSNNTKPWNSIDDAKKKDMDARMAHYAAMVDRMDQNIGKLVEYLKSSNQLNNTLILFLSDNGGCAEGGQLGGKADPYNTELWNHTYGTAASYGEVWANASNTPFRKYKHYTHEGGISTPFIAYWPNGIKPQKTWYTEPAYLIDIMPTILSVTQTKYPKEYANTKITALSGIPLTNAFKGKALNRQQPLYFEHENNAAIRDGKWKLVGTLVSVPNQPDASKWELYDMSNDRTETNDLASKHPERVKEMADAWMKWAIKTKVYPKPDKKTSK